MGYPDVQDGQPRRIRPGGDVPDGPGYDQLLDEDWSGHTLPASPGLAPAAARAADAPGATPGNPADGAGRGRRTGAHRAAARVPGDWPAPPNDRPGAPGNQPGPASDWPGPPGTGAWPARVPGSAGGDRPSRAPGFGAGDRGGPGRPIGAGPDDRGLASRAPGAAFGGRRGAPSPGDPARSLQRGPAGRGGLSDRPGDGFGARRTPGGGAAAREGNQRLGGPIRGFPPLPGQADPVYPPGQFSAWNRASTRAAWLGVAGAGGRAEADAEPGYSALAVSDPSADATATQTWAVIDDDLMSSGWVPARTGRDRGPHSGETGPMRERPPGARPGAPGGEPAPGGRGTTGGRGATSLGAGATTGSLGAGGITGSRAAGPVRAEPPRTEPARTDPARTEPSWPGSVRTGAGPAIPGRDEPGLPGPAGRRTPFGGAAERPFGRPAESPFGGAAESPFGLRTSGKPSVPGTFGDPGKLGERDEPGDGAERDPAGQRTATQPRDFGEGGRRSRAAGAPAAPAGRRAGRAGGPGASRRTGRSGKRSSAMMAALLLVPVLIVILVVGGYVYLRGGAAAARKHTAAPPRPAAVSASPAPTLGPWKHIESRTQDPSALSLSELFPQTFSAAGASGTKTVDKASTKCSHEVIGSKLAAAVRKADCTQVLRASYLSTDRKIMATVGVLNLADVTAAEHAGKVTGSTQFIKQLTSAHGPTRKLSKGTGIELAEFKGHYLILIWTEFTNLRAPSSKAKRKELESFSAGLITGTVNVSLTNRMVTGHP